MLKREFEAFWYRMNEEFALNGLPLMSYGTFWRRVYQTSVERADLSPEDVEAAEARATAPHHSHAGGPDA